MFDFGIKQSLFFILAVLLFVAWLVFLLRVWARLVVLKKFAADDYLMLAAMVFFTGYSAAGFYGVVGSPDIGGDGNGKDGPTLEKEASIGLQSWWLCEVLYPPVSLLSRTSVGVLLLRIAVERVHRKIIVCVILAFWTATIPLFFFMVFQCNPVDYFWKQPLPGTVRGTCLDNELIFVVSVTHTTISACCDWILGLLPLLILWKVQVSRRTKASLFFLLSLGMVAGITLIVRIVYLRPVPLAASFSTKQWYARQIDIAKWSVLEPGICIVAGCLGTLRPLFGRWEGPWTRIKSGSARIGLGTPPGDDGTKGGQSALGTGNRGVQGSISSNAYRGSKQFQTGRSGTSYLYHGFGLDNSVAFELETRTGDTTASLDRDHGILEDDDEKRISGDHADKTERSTCGENSGDEESNAGERTPGPNDAHVIQPLRRVRPAGVRRTSIDSDFSTRFPSFTASATSPKDATLNEKQEMSLQGRWPQWHHPLGHNRNVTEPVRSSTSLGESISASITAPERAHTAKATPLASLDLAFPTNTKKNTETPIEPPKPLPISVPSTALSSMPCRVLVQTMTEVEYDDAAGPVAPSALSMPAILKGEGTTNSVAGKDLPRSMTFQGSHTVQISGPATKP